MVLPCKVCDTGVGHDEITAEKKESEKEITHCFRCRLCGHEVFLIWTKPLTGVPSAEGWGKSE